MASIVEEIEREALDSKSSLSDLLRKARVIAFKLNLKQPANWVESELSGYKEQVPDYRMIHGQAKVRNPYHGWQPVMIGDPELEVTVCRRGISIPIKEIEHLVEGKGDLHIPLAGSQAEILCRMSDVPTLPISIFFGKNSLVAILDTVRNKLLDWTLSLQAAGIKGEGLSFSPMEKAVANNPNVTYHIGQIGNFSGNLGGHVGRDVSVTSSQTSGPELAKVAELVAQIRALGGQMGLPEPLQIEMRAHVDALDEELKNPQPQTGRIKGLLKSVKTIAEGVAGNVIAAGISSLAGSIDP